MAKTNWVYDELVTEVDMNQIGSEINANTEALENKVDKILGKGLSEEDFTTLEKAKLAEIEPGAQINTVTSVSGKMGDVTLVKQDVGLSDVENYSIATQSEASAGTVSTKYMTPLSTKQAITAQAAALSHTHTKAEIGLGSVQNYDVATQAEAQAGAVSNKYMTPLLTKQAITSQAGAVPHNHNASNITTGTLDGNRGVVAGATNISFLKYNGTTRLAGTLYGGTTVPSAATRLNYDGYLYATRVYNAVYNDYAEYYERGEQGLEEGDVISLLKDGELESYGKSQCAYDTCVVGVFSDSYAQCIGGDGAGDDDRKYVPVGKAGRVMVKVTGKVEKGDLLVSSDIPGVAMAIKSCDYISGTVFGKALHRYDGQSGIQKIRMEIMLA